MLATVYLVFNEGYAATSGPRLVRDDLVDEAVRLARLLVRAPARRPRRARAAGPDAAAGLPPATRVDADGATVLLRDQDRTRWDAARIEEGVTLVGEGLQRSPDRPDRYVVQAAIAACHALAPPYDETDWDAIVSWYDVLLTLDPGPVVRLNRAAAVAERDGAAAGLALVDAIDGLDRLRAVARHPRRAAASSRPRGRGGGCGRACRSLASQRRPAVAARGLVRCPVRSPGPRRPPGR